MTDSVQLFPAGWRLEDANGNPVPGGKLKFYAAGTTTPLTVYANSGLSVALGTTVYCDSGGYPVTASGGSTKTLIFTGTDAYKIVITDDSDVTLATHDNIPGAIAASSFATGASVYETPVDTHAAAYTVVADDLGHLLKGNPSGGDFTFSLLSAVTAGNGGAIGVKHAGTSGLLGIAATSGQEIQRSNGGSAATRIVLTAPGETVWLKSDGANWNVDSHTPGFIHGNSSKLTVVSRLSEPPSSPSGGALYIISGTPSGAWLSYAADDVVESDGNGSWTKYTPPANCGWNAYVQAEEVEYQYRGSEWVSWSNITAPAVAYIRQAIFAHILPSGTAGGTATAGAYTKGAINTQVYNTIRIANGASGDSNLASDQITLPTGVYDVEAWRTFSGTAKYTGRFVSTTDSAKGFELHLDNPGSSHNMQLRGRGRITVSATSEVFELRYYVSVSQSGSDLGAAGSVSGRSEYYAQVTVLDMESLRGPQGEIGLPGTTGPSGSTGPAGATGAAAPVIIDVTFDTGSTADSDPGAGKWKANSATPASVTTFYADDLDRLGNSIAAEYATWDDSTSIGSKGKLSIIDLTTTSHRWLYDVTAYTAASGYSKITVTHTSGTAAFPAGNVAVQFIPRGDKGTDGAGTGDFSSNTSTSVDGEMVLFSGTAGKTGKRSTLTGGMLKSTSGVPAIATAGSDYVAPATATAFTAQQNATPSAISSGVAWDVAAKQNATATVSGSTFTIANPSNAVTGGYYTLEVTYSSSNTLGWGTNYKGVSSITPSATSGKTDHFVFRYDGIYMKCVGYRLDTGA